MHLFCILFIFSPPMIFSCSLYLSACEPCGHKSNRCSFFFPFLSSHNCSIHTYVPSALEHCVLTLLLDFKTINICIFLDPVQKSDAQGLKAFVSAGSLYSYFPVVGCWYSNPFRANKLPANKLWKETRGKNGSAPLWKLANEISHRLLWPPAAVMANNRIGKGSCSRFLLSNDFANVTFFNSFVRK